MVDNNFLTLDETYHLVNLEFKLKGKEKFTTEFKITGDEFIGYVISKLAVITAEVKSIGETVSEIKAKLPEENLRDLAEVRLERDNIFMNEIYEISDEVIKVIPLISENDEG